MSSKGRFASSGDAAKGANMYSVCSALAQPLTTLRCLTADRIQTAQ